MEEPKASAEEKSAEPVVERKDSHDHHHEDVLELG